MYGQPTQYGQPLLDAPIPTPPANLAAGLVMDIMMGGQGMGMGGPPMMGPPMMGPPMNGLSRGMTNTAIVSR